MGKKMWEKDELKRDNNQVEESNAVTKETDFLDASAGNMKDDSELSSRDDNKNKRKEESYEKKKDRMKKRKSEFGTDKKDSQKAPKKHKKCKDGVCEVKEASIEICIAVKENRKQESSKAMCLEKDVDSEAKRGRKDKHQQEAVVQESCSTEDNNSMVHGEEGECGKRKKKKKHKLEKATANDDGHIAGIDGSATDKMKDREDGNAIKKVEDSGNGKKRKKKSSNYGLGVDKPRKLSAGIDNCQFFYRNGELKGNATKCRKSGVAVDNDEDGNRDKKKKKKKKSKSLKTGSDGKEISKKVSFSDHVEVFPCTDYIADANMDGKEGLVYGKRYSKEEDGIVMHAVANYIESHNLGEEGLDMVLNCRAYPQVKNCWKEIQAAIPWRPRGSVYHRAHVLFERGEKRPYTAEEIELIQKFVKIHGRRWKLLGKTLGKHMHHVKDIWRNIKLTNRKKGHWSQDEFQNLFDLVNLDLSMRAFEERKSKHGMLRGNICWTAISDKMQTRSYTFCCKKWYHSLASPMVAEGVWADADDYRLLDALSTLDACCMEDVDWDNLIEHRSGDLCRKRWNQIVQHIGPHGVKSFAEQVEVLANRYRPDIVKAREAYDSKTPVDLP